MDEKEDLQCYAEFFTKQFMETKYMIIDSHIYFKKYNLTSDMAQWAGWKIHSRDKNRDVIVILLRRSYIPPLIDSFQDIAIILTGPKNKSIRHQESPNYEEFHDSCHTTQLAHFIANNFHPVVQQTQIYEIFIAKKVNALLLSEKDWNFYRQRHKTLISSFKCKIWL